MIRTTPAGTMVACGMMVMGWPSRFSMPCLVLLQAENVSADGKLNSASCLMRSFTGEVSSRSMCRPGP